VYRSFHFLNILRAPSCYQCDLVYRRTHKRGEPWGFWNKFGNGLLIFLALVLVLFGPLLLFSSANPVSSSNNVQSAQLSLSIVAPNGEFELLSISSVSSNTQIRDPAYADMKTLRLVDENDKITNIQNLTMVRYSDDYWKISPPSLAALQASLQDPDVAMSARLTYSFTRPGPANYRTVHGQHAIDLSNENCQQLARVFNHSDPSASIRLPGLSPAYLRLPATADPVVLSDDYYDVNLTLRATTPVVHAEAGNVWWELQRVSKSSNDTLYAPRFICVNNPIWQGPLFAGLSYSVIGLYVTVVLAVGQFVRFLFANQVQRIQFEELHDVDDLIKFCDGIYIARQNGDLLREEKLYRRLIKIYRTPELMVRLTARRDPDEGDADKEQEPRRLNQVERA